MRYILALLVTVITCHCLTASVHAQTSSMDSQSYKIRLGNFNMTSGYKSSTTYQLTDTVGQIAAEFFYNNNYHVKAGFQYIYALYDFSFNLSSLSIDLNPLSPNTFSNASHTLTVTAPGQGYSVAAFETRQLTSTAGDEIPDTLCDTGPCTESLAEDWVIPTNNGFGYNITGDDKDPEFSLPTQFRPFPDFSADEPAATIMTSVLAGKNRIATVNYRISPAADQASGTYTTQIVFIATPVY
jgi:hypothetical protein